MSIIRLGALVLLLAMSSSGFAGLTTEWKEVGNGGKIIRCDSTVQSLDVYEAKNVYYWHPQPASLSLANNFSNIGGYGSFETSLQRARQFLLRLKERDVPLWEKYDKLQDFQKETLFLADRELADITDLGSTVTPIDCTLHQLVIQRNHLIQGKRYLINRKLWLRIPYDQQAAMILHEVVYFEALHRKKILTDSEPVRQMTGLILSQELETLPQSFYILIKKRL